jgi:hypothetical protein
LTALSFATGERNGEFPCWKTSAISAATTIISDKLVDRLDLSEGNTIGQHFQFELEKNEPVGRAIGASLLIVELLCGAGVVWR